MPRPPRFLAARAIAEIRRWRVMPGEGRCVAREQPATLADATGAFFRPLRAETTHG
jgi:hypothetical protein